MENHDPDFMESKHPFEQFEGETAQSVAMGNHNGSSCKKALACELQYGLETSSVEVDAGSDVCDDVVFWEMLAHVLDLSLEVIFLSEG